MLRFDSVAMRYPDGTMALDRVSLQLPRGQFCVVLGASGAGKSTLLRMANGLVTPTSGAVHVEDQRLSLAALSSIRPRIGMIHQQFNLVLRASVATNVLSGALPRLPWWRALTGLFPEAVRRKACELVSAVGLEEQHLRRRASELSGGQQQRAGIARAFMLDPPLVLADEPVASLDPQASHDVLALRRGQVVFDGPAQAFGPDVARAVYASGAAPRDAGASGAAHHSCEPKHGPQTALEMA